MKVGAYYDDHGSAFFNPLKQGFTTSLRPPSSPNWRPMNRTFKAACRVACLAFSGWTDMTVVAVINRKGGSGKSTLATHLAAYWAGAGLSVMLGDVDRNQSAQSWLQLRKRHTLPGCKPICGGAVDPKNVLRLPPGVDHAVLDTPGGLSGFELARVVCHADAVLIPVCPSMFDLDAAAACYAELSKMPRVGSGRCKVAAVGMRVDMRSKALPLLQAWAARQQLPFIGTLRDTAAYVHCVNRGLSLFDLPPGRLGADLAQWAPIIDWLQPLIQPRAAAGARPSLRPSYKPNAPPTAPPTAPQTAAVALPVMASARTSAVTSAATSAFTPMPAVRPPAQKARPAPSLRTPLAPPPHARGWAQRLEQAWSGLPWRRLLIRHS